MFNYVIVQICSWTISLNGETAKLGINQQLGATSPLSLHFFPYWPSAFPLPLFSKTTKIASQPEPWTDKALTTNISTINKIISHKRSAVVIIFFFFFLVAQHLMHLIPMPTSFIGTQTHNTSSIYRYCTFSFRKPAGAWLSVGGSCNCLSRPGFSKSEHSQERLKR